MSRLSQCRADAVLAEYDAALADSTLSPRSRRVYRSRVAGYLSWLAGRGAAGADPLADSRAGGAAVREYREWLTGRPVKPTTINATLTALDHFYKHLRVGPVASRREELASGARRILDADEQREFLSALDRVASTRDRAIAHAMLYAGLRAAEVVALDLPDVLLRKGFIVVRDLGTASGRTVPLARQSRPVLRTWLTERTGWPDSGAAEAVFLNQRGGRLTDRSVTDLVARIGSVAGLNGDAGKAFITPQVLRHTFANRLLRGGADIESVARIMGHKRLDTTRRYIGTGTR